eukprot:CAMPEP_0182443668 /NCGR_PEP_ID=MMETSP1172-20130603/2344_1 /TAXON_ID=708627 /ORGANISM="Timspurckia oligopyrenoides, Strain CCMP3278" /LENGTH=1106 /DNA_ID=CAMNT_0024639021 /DNA_START=28 /DNA_END=3348 /DNA_ORIENTATION=-
MTDQFNPPSPSQHQHPHPSSSTTPLPVSVLDLVLSASPSPPSSQHLDQQLPTSFSSNSLSLTPSLHKDPLYNIYNQPRFDSSIEILPLELDIAELRVLKDAFHLADPTNSGLDLNSFCSIISPLFNTNSIHSTPQTLFNLFDIDNSNLLTLKEFICGYAILCRGSKDQRMKFLFNMFDESNDGVLHFNELRKVIKLLNTLALRSTTAQKQLKSRNSKELEVVDESFEMLSENHEVWSDEEVDNVVKEVLGDGKEMDFEGFVEFVGGNQEIDAWLDELSSFAGSHLKTLRATKEHEMIALELERMGILESIKLPSNYQSGNSNFYNRNPLGSGKNNDSKQQNEHIESSSIHDQSSSDGSHHGNLQKWVTESMDLSVPLIQKHALRHESNNSHVSLASLDDTHPPHASESLETSSSSGFLSKKSHLLETQGPVSRYVSRKQKVLGPNLSVRRSKQASTITDSPFAIDYESLRLKRIIGKGSFATVWAAEWLHMPVAVKVFHSQDDEEEEESVCEDSMDVNGNAIESSLKQQQQEGGEGGYRSVIGKKTRLEQQREAYLREIELLSQLRHPNVLLYMGACLAPDKPFCIVTEFYNGGSVHDLLSEFRHQLQKHIKKSSHSTQRLTKSRALYPREALHLCIGVARGMLYLHSSTPTILHRDLKTFNILVDRTRNHCVICDFGLSRLGELSGGTGTNPSGEAGNDATTSRQSVSRHGSLGGTVGTPYTMAPEIMEGEIYTPAADVYSFGIVLWEMWTGRVPFEGLKPIQLMFQVFSENARPNITPEDCFHPIVESLMEKCWSQEKNQRPNFEEILEILESEQLQAEVEQLTIQLELKDGVLVNENGHPLTKNEKRSMTSELMNFVYAGNAELVEELLDQGVDVNGSDYDKRTPLHVAASECALSVLKLLLERGANVNVKDRWGSTPLDDAKREQILLSQNDDVVEEQSHEEMVKKNREIIELLVKSGGVSNKQSHFGSGSSGDLGESGKDSDENEMLSMQMMVSIRNGSVDDVNKLLERGANVRFCDYDHRTALHIAASEGKTEIAKLLIEKGALLDVRDRWASTPLHDAQRAGHREIQLLLEVAIAKQEVRARQSSSLAPDNAGITSERE